MSLQKFNPMSGQFDMVNQSSLVSDPDPTLSADLNLDGHSIVTNAGQDLPLSPGAGGNVIIDENTWPSTDGTPGQVVKTDGAGTLYWAADDAGLSAASNLETQQATLTTKAVTPASLNAVTALGKDTGFVSWGGSGVYYTKTANSLTLKRPGTGYIQSKRVDWLANQTVSSLLPGITHYIYINSSGIMGAFTSATQSTYENYIILFEMWVDATTPTPISTVVRENHPYSVQTDVSMFLHRVIGPVIQNTAGGANITLVNTKELKIVGTDVLEDHGLETIVPDSTGNAVSIHWCYTDASGKWINYLTQTTTPSIYNAAGTPTALPANRYGVFRIYVSKDDLNSSTPTYYAVINTAHYASLIAARAGINTGVAAATAELADIELAQLGYIIFSQASDSIVEVQIQKATLRGTITGAGASNLASAISTNTATFNGALSAADTNVQTALETLDDAAYTIVTTYNASGTHTLSTRAKYIDIILVSGGNAGGSGRRGDVNTDRFGGGGGTGGQISSSRLQRFMFTPSFLITVGGKGIGGTAITVDNTNGNAGSAGGISDIASKITTVGQSASNAGQGGTVTGGVSGGTTTNYSFNGWPATTTYAVQGGRASSISATPTSVNAFYNVTTGGGGGGGINTANVERSGGSGNGISRAIDATVLLAGGLTATPGNNGGNGNSSLVTAELFVFGSTGGGGGGASKTANAGAGGNGAWPGGGGGGGGASLNGFNSGRGGDGGDGGVIIIEYL